jgi:hypothetical protein
MAYNNPAFANKPIRDPNIPKSVPDKLFFSFWPPRLSTPPMYDDLFKPNRDIQSMAQDVMEGFKVDIPRTISEFFSAHHSFVLSNDQNAQKYSFSISGMPTPYSSIQGRVDSDWNVQGKWNTAISPRLNVTFNAQAAQEDGNSGCSFESDYRGNDWWGGFMWANPGIYRVTYSQSVTERLAMGGELAYNHKQAASFGSIGAIYRGNRWSFASMLSFPALQLSYWQRVTPRLEVGIDYLANLGQHGVESKVDLAVVAHISGRSTGTGSSSVATHIGSDWHVHTTVNFMAAEEVRLSVGGDFDYAKSKYTIGAGVAIA